MDVMTSKKPDERESKPRTITVTVNNHPVRLTERKLTGAEIKAAAIVQGVKIQQDFVLFEVKPGDRLKQIGDDERVTLQDEDKLQAVAPDDNS